MDWLNHLLAPFAAYPRWFVLTCFAVVAVGVGWVVLKIVKWTVYLTILCVAVALVLVVVAWLLG
ncbi:MAG TPA: hypothetical protein VLW52_13990 [Opitutaceae bacterium]|nr:hypothetical protein [Opitutaceae bacterium]HUJ44707.1 hypothetical protein [Opitutaceae bacterium]